MWEMMGDVVHILKMWNVPEIAAVVSMVDVELVILTVVKNNCLINYGNCL